MSIILTLSLTVGKHHTIQNHWRQPTSLSAAAYTLADPETWQIKRALLCTCSHHKRGDWDTDEYKFLRPAWILVIYIPATIWYVQAKPYFIEKKDTPEWAALASITYTSYRYSSRQPVRYICRVLQSQDKKVHCMAIRKLPLNFYYI